MGQARTGTGKTAAFAIPILERLDHDHRHRHPRALVLVPTRELAVQVRDEFVKLAHGRRSRCVAVYGGKPIRQQIEKLRGGADIAVGTPGRVMDLMARGSLVLTDIQCVVLDEADRMLDIGFRPDIEKILRRLPNDRQTLLLSATIPPPVERLARRYMRDPEVLNFSPADVSVDTIEQHYFTVDAEQKFELLLRLIEREDPRQAIIFCRTKRGTDKIFMRLSKKIAGVACIHGDLPQSTRDRVMAAFRTGKTRFLVATDVVGRGIDVTGISHIINYDIPAFCDDYVHRVGRTGRMGREGVAFTFVTPEEGGELTRIEVRINRLLVRDEIPGFYATAGQSTAGKGQMALDGEPPPEPGPPKPKPPFAREGRGPKRYRRAL
jgi:ATP-dependent RNA helicase DeaD